jgi:hypothetical protein
VSRLHALLARLLPWLVHPPRPAAEARLRAIEAAATAASDAIARLVAAREFLLAAAQTPADREFVERAVERADALVAGLRVRLASLAELRTRARVELLVHQIETGELDLASIDRLDLETIFDRLDTHGEPKHA